MLNWRTTAFAVIAFLGIALRELGYMLDSDPATVTNWNMIISALSALLAGLGITGLGFFARDTKVSDEQAGAGVKPPYQ